MTDKSKDIEKCCAEIRLEMAKSYDGYNHKGASHNEWYQTVRDELIEVISGKYNLEPGFIRKLNLTIPNRRTPRYDEMEELELVVNGV